MSEDLNPDNTALRQRFTKYVHRFAQRLVQVGWASENSITADSIGAIKLTPEGFSALYTMWDLLQELDYEHMTGEEVVVTTSLLQGLASAHGWKRFHEM